MSSLSIKSKTKIMDLIRCKNNKNNYFCKIFNVNFSIMINGNHTMNKATIINAAIILHTYLNIFFLISSSIVHKSRPYVVYIPKIQRCGKFLFCYTISPYPFAIAGAAACRQNPNKAAQTAASSM